MADLTRISISLEESLLEQFDEMNSGKGYATRSEAIRDLIRDRLLSRELATTGGMQTAVLSLVYDHHARELAQKLMDKQHDHHDLTVATMHVHMDQHTCLEVTILRGPGKQIRRLGEELISVKGVIHGEITFAVSETSVQRLNPSHKPGKGRDHDHDHDHG